MDPIQKLHKIFRNDEVLYAEDLQPLADRIDLLIEEVNKSREGVRAKYYEEGMLDLLIENGMIVPEEGVFYCEIEGEVQNRTWRFGDSFPIRFS